MYACMKITRREIDKINIHLIKIYIFNDVIKIIMYFNILISHLYMIMTNFQYTIHIYQRFQFALKRMTVTEVKSLKGKYQRK